jgi:hypothetical protein
MKISQKQAELLAKEIHDRLKRQRVGEVSELTKAKLAAFKDKRQELADVINKAKDELNKHDATFGKITGNVKGIYGGSTMQEIIDKLKSSNLPSVHEICDKIILKSMFASTDDMENFVETIVKDFTKKKPSNKALSN